jgi:hypothetical protein
MVRGVPGGGDEVVEAGFYGGHVLKKTHLIIRFNLFNKTRLLIRLQFRGKVSQVS